MSTFKDVEIIKAANIYFDGNVTSRVIKFNDGSSKTLGIMMPGEFNWQTIQGGESFEVPAHSIFKLKVMSVVDYCCSYS